MSEQVGLQRFAMVEHDLKHADVRMEPHPSGPWVRFDAAREGLAALEAQWRRDAAQSAEWACYDAERVYTECASALAAWLKAHQ